MEAVPREEEEEGVLRLHLQRQLVQAQQEVEVRGTVGAALGVTGEDEDLVLREARFAYQQLRQRAGILNGEAQGVDLWALILIHPHHQGPLGPGWISSARGPESQ